jgi:hypothetical protein
MANGVVASPLHILTPQSRPQSPSAVAAAGTPLPTSSARLLGAPRLNARGEALSEQLRPRSPPEGRLERIPPLRQVSAQFHRRTLETSTVEALHTRISELELVNDLFKSKVTQLEYSESMARKSEASIRQSELELRKEIEELRSHNRALGEQLRRAGLDPASGGGVNTVIPAAAHQNPAIDRDDHIVKRIKVSDIM